ncbi:MAG: hypothetical protein KF757_07435 [Phycisphaeraceae bacterium]|nr:hypothetical protein [Phycisphaeraceae bacterium]MCW5764317.1 hypothetical protein [Phycisphaeraceae bacterium]
MERLRGLDPVPMVRPHARHLVSDVPGCLGLLRSEPRFRLAFEPALLFEPVMFAAAEDHLERMFGALALAAEVVVISDVQMAEQDGDAWCVPVAFGSGLLPREVVVRLTRKAAAEGARLFARSQAEAEALRAILS